jgi:hypothetical protein
MSEIWERISRPNYRVEHPARSQEGRISLPNFVVRHPAERQNEQPFTLADLGYERGRLSEPFGDGPWLRDPWFAVDESDPGLLEGGAIEDATDAARDAADEASDFGGGLWQNRGIVGIAVVIGVLLFLARPLLEIVANLSEPIL